MAKKWNIKSVLINVQLLRFKVNIAANRNIGIVWFVVLCIWQTESTFWKNLLPPSSGRQ
jgi:hypothetical protein